MRCINCGKSIKETCKFCPNCGHKVHIPRSRDLVVIGNGFDMFLGLYSSFTQFFGIHNKHGTYYHLYTDICQFINYANRVNKKCRKHFINDIYGNKIRIDSSLLLKYIEVLDIRKAYGVNDSIFTYNDSTFNQNSQQKLNNYLSGFISKLKLLCFQLDKCSNLNFWAVYLILRKHTKDKHWASIESEMYNFLMHKNTDFYLLTSYLYNMLLNKNYYFTDNNENNNNLINKYLDQKGSDYIYGLHGKYIITILSQMLNKNKFSVLSSFDGYLIIYIFLHYILISKSLHKLYKSHYLNNISFYRNLSNVMCSFFNRQLSVFEYNLDCYLYKMCYNQYHKYYGLYYTSVSRRLLNCISSNNEFSLINFNYTNPYHLDELYGKKNNELVNIKRNIHGQLLSKRKYKLDNDYTRKSPIIGISDENIGITNPKYVFTKNYRIMRLSCNNYNNVFRDKKYIMNIEFFGQSFAPADYSYFFSIFDELNILHSNVKLIFYYATHGNKSDDDCARSQMNKIDSLFFNYCKEKNHFIDKSNEYLFKYCSNRSKEIVHALSFEGRLIVSNLSDKINQFNKYNYKNRKYSELFNYISRIISINDLSKDIKKKFILGEYYNIKNINKVMDLSNYSNLNTIYQKFMKYYDKWQEISKDIYNEKVNNYAKEFLDNLHGIFVKYNIDIL